MSHYSAADTLFPHKFFFLAPDREPREAVSFSSRKGNVCLAGRNPEREQPHFIGKIHKFQLSPLEFLRTFETKFKNNSHCCFCFFTQGYHVHDAAIKLPSPWVTCSFTYQHLSLMQMRTLSSPVCLPLIMTPIKDSHQLGDTAIVIATQ